MNDANDSKARTKQLTEGLLRIMLRMLPFGATPEIFDLVKDMSRKRTELDVKISMASEALKQTSGLLEELETGLKERGDKLAALKTEYEKYSKIAQIEEDKAQALLAELKVTVSKGKGVERLISLGLNLIAGLIVFVLGVWLGPKLTAWMGIGTP